MELRDGAWQGARAWLIGGGPSLRNFDFHSLPGSAASDHTLTVNAAFKFVPWADAMLSEDERVFRRFAAELRDFKGLKIFACPDDSYVPGVLDVVPDATIIRSCPKSKGWPRTLASGLSTSSNSMIPALHLADILGADPIYVLGVDCKPGQFHDLYPGDWRRGLHELESWKGDFRYWASPNLKHRKVYNLTPIGTEEESALDVWPKWDRDSFIRQGTPNTIPVEFARQPSWLGRARLG